MTDDGIHPVSKFDVPFYEVNLHCYTNDLLYGDGNIMAAKIIADDVASFRNGNLRDIFIQNATAGNNGQLVAVATVPIDVIKKILRF
jgi:hypothetical protein